MREYRSQIDPRTLNKVSCTVENEISSRIKNIKLNGQKGNSDPKNPLKMEVETTTGERLTFSTSCKIQNFLRRAIAGKAIDARAGEFLMRNLSEIVPAEERQITSTPSSTDERDLDRLSLYLREEITKAYQEAQRLGKPLLILMGEDHSEYKSMMLELMVMNIAREFGIANLMEESSEVIDYLSRKAYYDEVYNAIIGQFTTDTEAKLKRSLGILLNYTLVFIDNYSYVEQDVLDQVFDYDPNRAIRTYSPEQRANCMNETILECNSNSLAIVGNLHVKDIMTYEGMNAQFHILPINVTCYKKDINAGWTENKTRQVDANAHTKFEGHETILYPKMSFDPYSLTHAEMLEKSLEAYLRTTTEAKINQEYISRQRKLLQFLKENPGSYKKLFRDISKPYQNPENCEERLDNLCYYVNKGIWRLAVDTIKELFRNNEVNSENHFEILRNLEKIITSQDKATAPKKVKGLAASLSKRSLQEIRTFNDELDGLQKVIQNLKFDRNITELSDKVCEIAGVIQEVPEAIELYWSNKKSNRKIAASEEPRRPTARRDSNLDYVTTEHQPERAAPAAVHKDQYGLTEDFGNEYYQDSLPSESPRESSNFQSPSTWNEYLRRNSSDSDRSSGSELNG